MTYKVGDRVRYIDKSRLGLTKGKIYEVQEIGSSSQSLLAVDGVKDPWWLYTEQVEPADFYVDCPTKEIWKKVVQKMLDDGHVWFSGGWGLKVEVWETYKENSCVSIREEGSDRIVCCSKPSYQEAYPQATFIPYQEYLGIVEEERVLVSVPISRVVNEKHKLSFRERTKNMLKSIPKRLKLVLSPGSQALYKLGWIDSELSPTSEGESRLIDLLWDKHAEELGKLAQEKVEKIKSKKKK